MPTDPRAFRLLQNLQTTLRAIVAGATYHMTVPAIAVKLDPDQNVLEFAVQLGVRPIVILAPMPERWDWDKSEKPNGILLWMPVGIYWINIADQTDDNSMARTYTRGCADIETALALDLSRGGLASHTRIVNQKFFAYGSEVWSCVDVELQVRRTYGAPNS